MDQIPIPYFSYSKDGNTVKFNNLSQNNPTSYEWDFGDNTKSTEENPTHVYTQEGNYIVKLIVSNDKGTSKPLDLLVGIGDLNNPSNTSIIEMIDRFTPSALMTESSVKEKIILIHNWQEYLQPLVHIPSKVKPEDIHNELKWPGLVNTLIAQLVAYETILQAANQVMSIAQSEVDSSTDTEGEPIPVDPSKPNQQIKSIETGPAKTEWYEDTRYKDMAEAKANMAKAFSSSLKAGGALDQLKSIICQQASRLRIYLPICGQLDHTTVVPEVIKHKHCGKHAANPFGITRRME